MYHEFRTPLNAIRGFGQLRTLEGQNAFSPTQQEYLAMIIQSGDHLLSLISEILDLASIEAGQLRMSMTALDPPDHCSRYREDYAACCGQGGHQIEF